MNKFNPDLYTENNETLLKYIKEDLSKWKHTLCSWTGSPNFANLAILCKAIYPMELSLQKKSINFFFVRGGQKWRSWPEYPYGIQGIQNSQNILEKVVQSWRIHSFQFQNLLQDKGN